MKRMIRFCKKMTVVLAACGFFGILYPGLCLPEDVCKVIWVTEEGEEASELTSDPEGLKRYYSLLSASPEEIKIKSRLLEAIRNILAKDQN